MPTHNGERFIREALDSLLAQDYPNVEILISDNGSTDGTQAISTEYVGKSNRVLYQRHDVNRGAAHNFEHVMRQARGTYFVWAADHDLWHPSFVARCVTELDADSTAVLAYPQTTLIDMDGQSIEVMDDAIDLSSSSALQRYRTLIWQLTICNMVYGMTRTASIQAIPSIPAVLGADHLVLAHLALQSTIVRIEEALFFRRQNRPPESAEEQQSRVLRSMAGAGSSPLSRPIESYRKLRDHHLRAVLRSSMTWQDRTIATIATLSAFRARFGVPWRIGGARALVSMVLSGGHRS